MYKFYDDLVPREYDFHVGNTEMVASYPEYNLPPLEVPNVDDPSTTTVVYVNDIFDLFNSQRLSGFDNDIVESIRSNILSSSPFADAISKLSDDEIMESIKPRNIQSPSQLVAWSKYVQAVIEERLANVSSETPDESGHSDASSESSSSDA